MQSTENLTTIVCLFHTDEQAQQALGDLQKSKLPPKSITVLGGRATAAAPVEQSISTLQQLQVPERDMRLLSQGLRDGGTIVVVSAAPQLASEAEAIFGNRRAAQVDEKVLEDKASMAASATGDTVIPIVEEELIVGKRQVERGGVRVYSRVVETPVEESILLREERATVNRVPVNRAVTQTDVDALQIQSIEVTEMAEVPVVQKSARVVEEVLVGKDSSERTQHVTDTVRKTEVEVEPVTAGTNTNNNPRQGNQ